MAVVAAGPLFAASGGSLGALAKIERGQWSIRGADGAERALCLKDPAALLRLEHGGANCSSEVLGSDPDGGTVRLDCPGRGYAHTSIRVETARSAKIDSQGLIDGRPFAYRAEARKTGAC